ncbi:hypothetical protein D3C73_841090 [compost metagenome]
MHVGAGIAAECRTLHALAAYMAIRRHHGGVLQCCGIGLFGIEATDALQPRIGEGHVRAGADHQVCVAGRGPARDPATGAVLLDEALYQLPGIIRGEQRIRRPGGAERVPEAVVDEDLAVAHRCEAARRAAVGVVIDGAGLAGIAPIGSGGGARILVAGIGVQVQPVQAGVQRGLLVVAGVADIEAGQARVPRILCTPGHAFQRIGCGDFQRQVVARLFDGDQRGRDAHRHPPLAACVELDVAGRAAGIDLAAAAPRLVEAGHHIHAGGAVGQAAAGIGVAGQRLRGGVEGQPTARIDVVEQQVGVAACGEIEAEQRGMVGWGDGRGDAVVEAHVVAIRARAFLCAVEGQRPLAAVRFRYTARGGGHHLEGLAVAHPRAGLVAQGERLQLRPVLRIVLLVPAVQPVQCAGIGHRRPEVEAVGYSGGREVVAT